MNYKELIIQQVSQHFAKAHLSKVRLEYDIKQNTCKGVGLTLNKKEVPIKLSKSEISLVQSMLIRKVKKLVQIDFKTLILSLDVEKREVNTYIKLLDDSLEKIELL
jgi:hypothetical protein